MFKNNRIKVSGVIILVLLVFSLLVPHRFIHRQQKFNQTLTKLPAETIVKTPAQDEFDEEKYEKPGYFNIFKFISSFIPSRQPHSFLEKKVGSGNSGRTLI